MILEDTHKEKLIKIFANYLTTECEVIAYGSRIVGDAHEASDLDLIIKSKNGSPIPKSEFKLISDKIRESSIPIIIDLRDWALVPDYFYKYIEKKNVVFYKNY